MADQAYLAWQADTRAGELSILIAADNAAMAYGRVPVTRSSSGEMTGSSWTAAVLSCGMERCSTSKASVGVWVPCSRGGGTQARGSYSPGAYLESSVELGYTTTTHGSQGMTVDTGHTVVTRSRLTRELLYVSMTRGRSGNFAYVSEGYDADHPAVDPSLQLSWQGILGEVLAAEGAERTAHEMRDAERRKADNLERLYAEYDYLAQIAVDLRQQLDEHVLAPHRNSNNLRRGAQLSRHGGKPQPSASRAPNAY